MKRIVIASGKGGTGKTTVAINLAYTLAKKKKDPILLLDCDVEAPNDNLFLNANFTETSDVTVTKPIWDASTCTLCSKCTSDCNFNALAKVKDKILVFNELCHSCGACFQLCPTQSFKENEVSVGKIELAPNYKPFSFGQGTLAVGESLAPTIIKKLKKNITGNEISIIDAPPGTTCPVVESLEGADYCILVTEPTPFGLNDLKLAVNLAAKLKIPVGIVINRSYGHDEIIQNFAKSRGIPIVGKIPFERKYAESYSTGKILIDEHPELEQLFNDIYHNALSSPVVPKIEIEEVQSNESKQFTIPETNNCKIKEIAIISGKGGTGKTSITSSLSELLDHKVMADNDVDASNLHLLRKPEILHWEDFYAGLSYSIGQDKCNSCGICADSCQFEAIKSNDSGKYYIDEIACEGCGLCSKICPAQAITSKPAITGKWFVSQTDHGLLSHAKLGIGEENSGKLVAKVRENASLLATEKILSDGPPGTGCPVIASITGVNLVLIVAEATLSGFHDMRRALQLTAHFSIPAKIIVNKFDLNPKITEEIILFAEKNNSKVVGKIPFDKSVHDALMKGKTITSYGKGRAYDAIQDLWKNLKEKIHEL